MTLLFADLCAIFTPYRWMIEHVTTKRGQLRIYGDEAKKPGDRVFGPIERVIYQVCRVDPGSEQRWSTYALSVLAFSVMSFLLLYGIARFQGVLPFNPTDKPAVTDHVAFNAAVSFMTNTNWQSYSGEATITTTISISTPWLRWSACNGPRSLYRSGSAPTFGRGVFRRIALLSSTGTRALRSMSSPWSACRHGTSRDGS